MLDRAKDVVSVVVDLRDVLGDIISSGLNQIGFL